MISDDERESLHFALDALLNARATLESHDAIDLDGRSYRKFISEPREDFLRNSSTFLRRVIGSKLHHDAMGVLFGAELNEDSASTEIAAYIANSILPYLPLFMKEGHNLDFNRNENIDYIIDDLMGIYWGDEPRFFAIAKKSKGLHKRPYRLAKLRLSALNWDKFLAAVGLSALERHRIISDAYGTDWDAIRKWAKAAQEQFDLISYPPTGLEFAREQYSENPDGVLQSIREDGKAYLSERGTGRTGKSR